MASQRIAETEQTGIETIERTAKIETSQNEIFRYLNFLEVDKYLNPESPILRKPGRENFFGAFHQEQVVYHVVNKWDKHELKCYMLVPKSLRASGKIPFHVIFHGGGMTTGGGNYVHWFNDYKLDLAINANAITLIPMYRLMPEDRGPDIYQDIDNWWNFFASKECDEWVESCLKKHEMESCIAKLSKKNLLVSGESAGGLLAVYSWLCSPRADIRALYLQYPVLNYYKKDMPKDFVNYMELNIAVSEIPRRLDALLEVVDKQRAEDRLASRSDTKPPIGMLAATLLSNLDRWKERFQAKDAPGLLNSLMEAGQKPASFPDIHIIHGTKDSAVPIENTRAFVKELNYAFKQWEHTGRLELWEVEGEGHAFDYVVKGKDFECQIKSLMRSIIIAWCK